MHRQGDGTMDFGFGLAMAETLEGCDQLGHRRETSLGLGRVFSSLRRLRKLSQRDISKSFQISCKRHNSPIHLPFSGLHPRNHDFIGFEDGSDCGSNLNVKLEKTVQSHRIRKDIRAVAQAERFSADDDEDDDRGLK